MQLCDYEVSVAVGGSSHMRELVPLIFVICVSHAAACKFSFSKMRCVSNSTACQFRLRLGSPLCQPKASSASASAARQLLPVIDVAPFLRSGATAADRLEVAKAWDAAMSSMGLVQIIGHGVDSEAIDGLAESGRAFFEQSHEQKMESCLHKGYGFGGYVPQGVEAVARSTGASAPADVVENIVFSYRGDPELEATMPPEPPEFAPFVRRYWQQMEELTSSLMRLSALGLGLDEAHFATPFAHPKCNLRIAYYPPMDANVSRRPHGHRYGAHTDYTGFTILRQDPSVAGLEAQTVAGEWVTVPPRKDALVINAGDLIQVCIHTHTCTCMCSAEHTERMHLSTRAT